MIFRAKCFSIIPSLIIKKIELNDKRVDEVSNLTILRMMARKNYILNCYEVMVESKIQTNRAVSRLLPGGEIDDCTCASTKDNWNNSIRAGFPTNPNIHFHFCPSNVHYKPNLFCKEHLECNDPIYRFVSGLLVDKISCKHESF